MISLYRAFLEQAENYPDAPAVIEPGRMYTYRDLQMMAERISTLIPKEGSFTGIVLDHSVWLIASILGVLKTGSAYVPAEPGLPVERIRFMMEESHAAVVLTRYEYMNSLPDLACIPLDPLIQSMEPGQPVSPEEAADCLQALAQCPEKKVSWMEKDHARWSRMPAYVLYTSGSTGVPKGVIVTNANVLHYVEAFYHEFYPRPGDLMLQYSVCSFDIFVEEVFTTLLNGAALLIPDAQTREDLPALLNVCREYKVTEITGFPYLLKEIDGMPLPPSVRLLISGGDVLRENYVRHLLDQTAVYNTYGPSETTVCASYFRCQKDNALDDGTFPIGHAVTGSRIVLLNEHLEPVQPGQMGEICILGEGVSSGYLDPSKNEMFTEYDGQPMYRSGDMGFLTPEGELAFTGRRDEQVMIWGKRVEPKETESILCKCRGICQAVVTSYQDSEHLYHLKAFIVTEKDCDPEQIMKQMQQYLPDFMIPEEWIRVDHIPLNDHGKPDLHLLAQREKHL